LSLDFTARCTLLSARARARRGGYAHMCVYRDKFIAAQIDLYPEWMKLTHAANSVQIAPTKRASQSYSAKYTRRVKREQASGRKCAIKRRMHNAKVHIIENTRYLWIFANTWTYKKIQEAALVSFHSGARGFSHSARSDTSSAFNAHLAEERAGRTFNGAARKLAEYKIAGEAESLHRRKVIDETATPEEKWSSRPYNSRISLKSPVRSPSEVARYDFIPRGSRPRDAEESDHSIRVRAEKEPRARARVFSLAASGVTHFIRAAQRDVQPASPNWRFYENKRADNWPLIIANASRDSATSPSVPALRMKGIIAACARAQWAQRVIKSNQEDFARANDARSRAFSRYNANKPDVDNSGVDIMTVCGWNNDVLTWLLPGRRARNYLAWKLRIYRQLSFTRVT